MWVRPITVAETETFVRQSTGMRTDEEKLSFVDFIARNPTTGDAIPDTGGVRKVRWSRQGVGKRGGTRVIYFFYHMDSPLYLLMVYAKARKEDLSPDEKKAVRAFTAVIKRNYPISGRGTS